MTITIIVERNAIPGDQGEIKTLLTELRNVAAGQPGFLSGHTLVDPFSPIRFMTTCTWSDLAAWELWKTSAERNSIADRIAQRLQGPPRTQVWAQDIDAPVGAV